VLPTVSSVENAVLNSLTASSIDTTKVQVPSGCSGNLSSKICYQRDVTLNPGDTPTELGVVVSLNYPVTFQIPFVGSFSPTITTQAQMREEN